MKGIEWIKLNTYMPEDEKMRLIDAMELRDPIHYLWIRILLQAGKVNDNGLVYLKKDVPYTKEMLSILFNRPIEIIEKVLEILESFQMIKIYESNVIKICNWEKHQNIEGMKRVREKTRQRVKNYREKKKIENTIEENKTCQKESSPLEPNKTNASKETVTSKIKEEKMCNVNVTLKREKREEDKEKEKKILDKEEREEIEEQALKILNSLQEMEANIKGLTLIWLKEAIKKHKEKYVKMAIREAIERNKLDINYVKGIFNNWLKEGYPHTFEDNETNNFSEDKALQSSKQNNLRFINFEPRQYDYKALEKKLLGW